MRLEKAGVTSVNPQLASLAIIVAVKARPAAARAGAKLSSFSSFELLTSAHVVTDLDFRTASNSWPPTTSVGLPRARSKIQSATPDALSRSPGTS